MARFILSKKKAVEQYNKVKKHCDYVYYSIKTNPEIAKILEKHTNSFFSVHFAESAKIISNKSRVLFFAQGWNRKEIKRLISSGITSFVVDNLPDLDALLGFLESENTSIEKLFLRLKMREHTIYTGKHYVFGMSSENINRLVPALGKNPRIREIGIHFHRKTQNTAEWSMADELEESLDSNVFKTIRYMNIGGGIPVKYKNYGAVSEGEIFERIKIFKQWLKRKNRAIKMIIEPGRFIAAPAVKLESTIRLVNKNNIILDCSIFNSAMDTFIADIRLEIEGELKDGKAYTVKGITPDSRDIFRYKAYLKDPKVNDKIVFLNAGAYNFSTDFCSLRKLKTIIVDDF